MSYEYTHKECATTGVVLKVVSDDHAESPREWCNAGTMVCDHGRYNLGDKDGHSDASDAICASRSFKQKWDEDYDFSPGPALWEMIQECEDIVSLPLYLFDHSGLALSTKRFSCPWDSGQVGFTFMTRATILKETGSKRLTKKAREWALSYLEAEADVYDKFLSG